MERAEQPREIPAQGLREALWRVKAQIGRDRLSLVSAGVAFYALLAAFPAVAAVVSLYGLAFDPQQVSAQISALEGVFPPEALEVLRTQVERLASRRTTLGAGAVAGLLFALWSASTAVRMLMQALNAAYDEREERGFLRRATLSLGLTVGAIASVLFALAAVVVAPVLLSFLGLDSVLAGWIRYARWPVLALAAVAGLAVLYRYGPSRPRPGWSWVAWGAVCATVLWIAGSALFSWYVSNIGRYNETYGSVAAVVILLLWFLLSAFAVLTGAEINAELERQRAGARPPS